MLFILSFFFFLCNSHFLKLLIVLTKPIKNIFSFKELNMYVPAEYDKDELVLPVFCVSEGAKIKVTVSDGIDSFVYDDWEVSEVERPTDDFSSFKVTYKSESASKCQWYSSSKVKVEITNGNYVNSEPIVINFKVSSYKNKKIGSDNVQFEQVN